MLLFTVITCFLGLFLSAVRAYDATDTLMDGDSSQSGYQPNHNIDPAIVAGGSFGQIWKYQTPTSAVGMTEQFFARPLVYTPSSLGRQVVLGFSEQNRLYVLDAVNGSLIAFRDLSLEGEGPFMVADLGSCNDISGTIGITGTPVIDPTTDTVYFWAKSYMQSGQRGYQNGAYRFHAVDAATLVERPGFPTNIQGALADNDHTRWFTGGTVLQRVSLNLVNKVVFAGFGGHCDQYNFTGWVVGMSASTGKYVTGYVTAGGPTLPPQDGTFNGGGGGSGVWMAGMPIVSDNSGRIFFSTGNGYKITDNQQQPASGRLHLDTLSECIVNLAVNATTGQLTQQDYFEPYAYLAMDAGDRDLGSGGVILPDPATFSGGGVARIIIACGKNAVCYVTNADNLGGYKLGTSGSDAILQSITPPSGGSMFANPGTYPLEGGYLYITPVGSPTYVYSLGFDTNGRPAFTLVSQTDDSSSGRVGTGPPVITTNKGQVGSAILWIMDPDAGPRAYWAVPRNGKMIKINLPAAPAISKYQRAIFGNGRYYLTSSVGQIVGFGSPVAQPLLCSSPVDFGSVPIGSYATSVVNCTANIAITKLNGLVLSSSVFQASNSSLPQGSLKAGSTFSFPVVFNLTSYVLSSGSTSAPAVTPGVQSTSLTILTTNGVTGFSTQQPVSLTGRSISARAFLTLNPLHADFPSIVIGAAADASGSSDTFIISNAGLANMTILGYAFSNSLNSTTNTNVTMGSSANGTYVLDSNGYFTSPDLPIVGSVLLGGQSITVHATFFTNVVGDDYSLLNVYTDGGSSYVILSGSADSVPITLLESSTNEGGWLTIPDCPIPADGCTTQIDLGSSPGLTQLGLNIRFSNKGGSDLVITKSKPPEGTVLGATNPNTDLSEGLTIAPGSSATAGISFSPGAATMNADPVVYSGTWTLNTNDLTFGVHVLNFTGTLAARQVGPLLSNGAAQYKYLGCFLDNSGGVRIEQKQYVNTNNTNGLCQQQALAYNVPFAGTEYMSECWVGSTIPSSSLQVPDAKCTSYLCSGDSTQLCGGAGGYLSLYYDSTKYFPNNGTLIGGYKPASSQPRIRNYVYAGCYSDSTGSRSLSGKIPGASSTNSLESCAAACAGYTYFGTEYASECYCGNSLASTAISEKDTDCSMICSGNATEICGSSSRLSIYALNGTVIPTASVTTTSASATGTATAVGGNLPTVGAYSYVDCHTDAVAKRTLSSKSTQGGTMTVEYCASYCAGYTYFGVEYSQQCYCGNSLLSTSATVTDGRCSMVCAGNNAEICGGSSGLSLYMLTPSNSSSLYHGSTTTVTPSSAPSSTLTTMTSSSSTSTSAAPAIPSTIGAYSYVECRSDNTTIRTLQAKYLPTADMTLERCAGNCTGYAYFGVEYSKECYCGNVLTYGSYTATDGRCTMTCGGNSNEICGGSSGLTLFRLTSLTSGSSSVSSSTTPTSSSSSSTSSLSTSTRTTSSSSLSSTSTSSTSTSTSLTSVSTTSSTSSSTSSSSTSLTSTSTSSASSTLTSTSSSSTATSSTSTSSVSATSTITSSSTSISSDSSSTTSSSTTSSSTTSSSTSSSLSSSSTSSVSSSTSTTMSTPTPTCPASNGSTYTGASGQNFLMQCGTDHSGGNLQLVYTNTYAQCIQACDSTALCVSFSWVAGGQQSPCYLKSSIGAEVANANIWGGKLVAASSTASSTSTSSSASTTSTSASLPTSTSSMSLTSSSTTSSSTSSSASSSSTSSSSSITTSTSSTITSSSTTTSTSLISSTTSSSTSSSASPSSTSSWAYMGCANDTTATRALSGATTQSASMTIELCQSYCIGKNYPLAGVEYANECYCGMSLGYSSTVGRTGCTMACAGNSAETCGGSSRLNVYNYTSYISPQLVPNVGTYNVKGCFTDSTTTRGLPSYVATSSTSMTVEFCVNTCQKRGYGMAGLENGGECYCANSLASTSTPAALSDCQESFCTGNLREYCGGSKRLLVYSV